MKIFISGIAGFLGSHLAETCIKKNTKLLVVTHLLAAH